MDKQALHDYFSLQIKLFNRWFTDNHLNVRLGYLILFTVPITFLYFLFDFVKFADYIFVLSALMLMLRLSDTKRVEFLKVCFKGQIWKQIRLLENGLIALPFLVVLLVRSDQILGVVLLVLVCFSAFFSVKTEVNRSFPTPFGLHPFEFSVGFRSSFWLLALCYILCGIALSVGNVRLAIFSFLLVFGLAISFLTKVEDEYYVWIFAKTPREFLVYKSILMVKQATVLVLPIFVFTLCCYPQELLGIVLFLFAGYVYLLLVLWAKYSVFPAEMNLIETLLIVVSCVFPPLLLFTLPFFYKKSLTSLTPFLK